VTTYEEVSAGQVLPSATYRVTRDDLRRYAEASGDLNPIHLDPQAALAVGLPDTIAHGMLVMALTLRAIEEWAGAPAAIPESSARWTKPVVVPAGGTELLVDAVVAEKLGGNRVRVKATTRCGADKVMTMNRVVVTMAASAEGVAPGEG
jgi:acyl dehydratase